MTALNIAAAKGYKDIIKILLENGADMNTKNEYGQTALISTSMCHIVNEFSWFIYATENNDSEGHKEVLKFLLKNDADINAKDNFGRTALFHATKCGNKDIVEILIQSGADINTKDWNCS